MLLTDTFVSRELLGHLVIQEVMEEMVKRLEKKIPNMWPIPILHVFFNKNKYAYLEIVIVWRYPFMG